MPDPDTVNPRADLSGRALELGRLHRERRPLVLPTAWDAWSAGLAVAAGFEALTIGSHPLADSLGAEDHEGLSFGQVLEAVRPIIASVPVPVSVDLESGYGQSPADLIAGLLEAGGVGLNIEDTVHAEDGRMRSSEEHAAYVAGLRAAADDAGVAVWINGRTDLFMHADDPDSVLAEAIDRLRALIAAGADSVYPVGIHDSDALIAAVVGALEVPVNITAHPVKHDLGRYRALGVGRVSFGPLWQFAMSDVAAEMLAPWRER